MDDGKHTTDDNSFMLSVARHVGGGIALVMVVAGAFWGVGQVQEPEPGNPVIESPDDSLKPTDLADGTGDESEAGDAATTAPDDAPETSAPTDADTPTPTGPAAEPTGDVDPAEVSVQILDAAGDGGERASAAGAALREDGYPIVAENPAARAYANSTIYYTEGHENEARHLASEHPEFTVVEPKPDNLSESVDVHVIIGEDYPAP